MLSSQKVHQNDKHKNETQKSEDKMCKDEPDDDLIYDLNYLTFCLTLNDRN